MNTDGDFDSLFAAEPAGENPDQAFASAAPWKVLLVDDEPDIHAVLRLAVHDIVVEGRPLQLLDATSAAEARHRLQQHPDIALILLDVVMEFEQAGLDLVRHIRDELHNDLVQIVLVTGQPGYAPQRKVITDYAINGYRLKSELTADKIFVSVYSALRTYQAMKNLDRQREELQALSASLQEEQARLRAVVETAPDAIVLASGDGLVTGWNPGAERLFGYTPEEIIGQPLSRLMPRRHQAGHDMALHHLRGGEAPHLLGKAVEIEALRRNGEEFPVEIVLGSWLSSNGRHYSAIMRDISLRREMEDQIRHLAFYDALTNLPNRRLLMDRLAQTQAACKRTGSHGALMMIDLDNFKPLNDTHGHETGDLLLIESARRIKGCLRKIDTVARFGGDEFVVVLGELDTDGERSTEQAMQIAEKIRAAIALPYLLQNPHAGLSIEHRCTASIGVGIFIDDLEPTGIFERADRAMYVAKNSGRNTVRHFDPAMNEARASVG